MMDMHPHSDNNFGCESNHLHYVLEYGFFIHLFTSGVSAQDSQYSGVSLKLKVLKFELIEKQISGELVSYT